MLGAPISRRTAVAALSLLAAPAPGGSMSNLAARPARIDGHLHLWSDGADWAEGASPPAALQR